MFFVMWVEDQLRLRGWSHAELARQGNISAAQISRVCNREQNPGDKFYTAIAQAFHMDRRAVLDKARSCSPL